MTDLGKHTLLVLPGSLFQKGLLLLANFIIGYERQERTVISEHLCLQMHLGGLDSFLNGILDFEPLVHPFWEWNRTIQV